MSNLHLLMAWICLILLVTCNCIQAATIRHVNECNFCSTCYVSDEPPRVSEPTSVVGRLLQSIFSMSRSQHTMTHQGQKYLALSPDMFQPGKKETLAKQNQPNCTVCYGCNTELFPMGNSTTFMGKAFHIEKGASSSWLFQANSDRVVGKRAVVKVYCLPIPKHGKSVPLCGAPYVMQVMQVLLAVQRVSEECGFEDIVPKVWVDKVDAVVPNIGYHVRWHGLWMEKVDGISLESLLKLYRPPHFLEAAVDAFWNTHLNRTQIVMAAIFDLLTGQCDRHAQNIMITDDGNLHLIDNEWSFKFLHNPCTVDSLFVPGTQKHTTAHVGNPFLLKQTDRKRALVDPKMLFDYRCSFPAGKMGTNFPPKVKQCLRSISGMTPKQVQDHYDLPNLETATNLHTRATDLLTKGYEWTAKYGKPLNPDPKRYRFQQSCCFLTRNARSELKCPDNYTTDWELPFGDPIMGFPWNKPDKADPGSYQGGSHPGDIE